MNISRCKSNRRLHQLDKIQSIPIFLGFDFLVGRLAHLGGMALVVILIAGEFSLTQTCNFIQNNLMNMVHSEVALSMG